MEKKRLVSTIKKKVQGRKREDAKVYKSTLAHVRRNT